MSAEQSVSIRDRKALEIAAEWKVSARHITGLAEAGKIPGTLVGGIWRFNAGEVRAAFESETHKRTRSKCGKSI